MGTVKRLLSSVSIGTLGHRLFKTRYARHIRFAPLSNSDRWLLNLHAQKWTIPLCKLEDEYLLLAPTDAKIMAVIPKRLQLPLMYKASLQRIQMMAAGLEPVLQQAGFWRYRWESLADRATTIEYKNLYMQEWNLDDLGPEDARNNRRYPVPGEGREETP